MFKAFARRAVLAAAISAVAFGTMGFQSNDGEDRRVRIINATLTNVAIKTHGHHPQHRPRRRQHRRRRPNNNVTVVTIDIFMIVISETAAALRVRTTINTPPKTKPPSST